ncbi:MAG: ATPase domain-containing protein, partial [Bacillota bacterium]
ERIFFDGITQLKYLTSDKYKFRKLILSFMNYVMDYNTTILLTSEVGTINSDDDLQFMVDGIIHLEYKNQNHTIEIKKYRGSSFKKGSHTLKFKSQGITVYPLLSSINFNEEYDRGQVSSGIPEINKLLHGGIEKGTTTTITGPSGAGKTTLGTQFIKEGAGKGIKSIIYTFEESNKTLLKRSKAIEIPLDEMIQSNNLIIKKVNPLEYTPDEFSNEVREDVEKNKASIVMLDSITGYFLSFNSHHKEQKMLRGLHALCEYLKKNGVTVFMINEMKNITGDFKVTDYNTSYLADNIIFLRYLEIHGKLKKAIGVLKKRMSGFENTMREYRITRSGIKVGEPLKNLRGILNGNPEIIEFDQEDK